MNISDIPFLAAIAAATSSVLPSDFPNLSGWWDASFLAYADSTAIDNSTHKFTDRSTNANHLVQGTSANQPVLKTNIVNGNSVIRFDGVASPNNDKLNFTSALTLNGSFTVVVVGYVNADSLFFGSSSANRQFRRYTSNTEIMSLYLGNLSDDSTNMTTAHASVCMMTWRRDGAANVVNLRENKSNRTVGSPVDGGTLSLDRMGICQGDFNQLNGDVCEAIIYSGVLTDANLDALYDSYLKSKWGLP